MAGEIIPDNSELEDPEDSSVGGSQGPVSESEAIRSTEESLAGRVRTALNSPRIEHDSMTPSSVSYRLLKEDLKFRSEHNKVLMQEQSMVGNMRSQYELGKLSKQNDDDSIEATEVMQFVQNLYEAEKPDEEIMSEVAKSFPNFWSNTSAVGAVTGYLKASETPVEKSQRELKSETAVLIAQQLKISTATAMKATNFDAKVIDKVLSNKETVLNNQIARADQETDKIIIDAGKIQLENIALQRAELQNIARERNITENTRGIVGAALPGKRLGTTEQMHAAEDILSGSGLHARDIQLLWENVGNPEELKFIVDGWRDGKGMFGMLAEKINKTRDPKDAITPTDIMFAISALGDPDVLKDAEADDKDAIALLDSGRRYIKMGAGVYRENYASALKHQRDSLAGLADVKEWQGDNTTNYNVASTALEKIKASDLDKMKEEFRPIAERFVLKLHLTSGRELSSAYDAKGKRTKLKAENIQIPDNATPQDVAWLGHKNGLWIYNPTTEDRPELPMVHDKEASKEAGKEVWVENPYTKKETAEQYRERQRDQLIRMLKVYPKVLPIPEGSAMIKLDTIPTK